MLTLSSLIRYPLKSARGQTLSAATVEPRGLAQDRRWMLIDAEGRFVTGRQLPRVVRLVAEPLAAGLRLTLDDDSIEVEPPPRSAPTFDVAVWKQPTPVRACAPEVSQWLSGHLGHDLRLVHQGEDCMRPVDLAYGRDGDVVSLADGFPLLLISQGSLDGLNARLPAPIEMARFRPNLVVDGAAPHAEDDWRRIRIGALEFDLVKPCTRCVFTTVLPDTGEFDPTGEPLNTLKSYRRSPKGITFGVNVIARNCGEVRLGDPVEIDA